MRQFNRLLITALVLLSYCSVFAQLKEKPKWTLSFSKEQVKVGDQLELIFKSKIEKNWYMYANDFDENVGPIVATIDFKKHPSYQLVGKTKPVGNHHKYDDVFEGDVSIFKGVAEFRQTVKILAQNPIIKTTLEFQVCSEVSGMCVLFEDDLEFKGLKVDFAPETETQQTKVDQVKIESPESDKALDSMKQVLSVDKKEQLQIDDVAGKSQKTIWAFLIFAFLGGLIAVITPCVFPMLPMTVSFFTKKSETKGQGVRRATIFGIFIILIYTSLGLLFAFFGLGPDFGNWLSTHWVPNVLFFLIFIVFGASFLGMFEITMPHSIVNKIDSQSSMGSSIGIFFMAFTLVLVSFSCTGPIVGSLLIEAVGGNFTKPLLGMAAFGFGLALPFSVFAMFPGWMTNLPKSGGWLNSVKVVLGFLELALAFKFLSIPDQTYHWHILDREVYLGIWIVIFTLLGLYLIGVIKFSHDTPMQYLGVPRLFLAIITFAFALYLVPGLWGAPLKALSGYLPPKASLDFDLYKQRSAAFESRNDKTEMKVKYADLFHFPHDLDGFFDYREALAYSKKVNKPIFIDFTGHGCVNCREMEANVWSSPEVLKRLNEDFILLALYVDDKTELPQSEWYVSTYDNREKKSIGKQNADLQINKFGANAQPYYVIIDGDENILVQPKAYDLEVTNFVNFLESGKAAFYRKSNKH